MFGLVLKYIIKSTVADKRFGSSSGLADWTQESHLAVPLCHVSLRGLDGAYPPRCCKPIFAAILNQLLGAFDQSGCIRFDQMLKGFGHI